MENPTFSDGAPKTDTLATAIGPDHSPSLKRLQARKITERCAVSIEMAATLAPYLFGDCRP